MVRLLEVRPLPPARHQGNLATLDMLRGGAALYVAAYHSVGALTPSGLRFDTEGGAARLLLQGNPLGLFGFGFYAVLAFFVLSGFVVHLRQAQRAEEPAQGNLRRAADYAWRRAGRLYPPLIAALALAAVLTALGNRLFQDWPWAPGTLTDARNVLLPVYGAASFANATILWSIAFEIWFYVAYVPLVLVTLGPLRRPMRLHLGLVLAGSLAVACTLLLIQGQAPQLVPDEVRGLWTIAIYFPAWAGGAFLGELYAAGVKLRRRGWAGAAAAVIGVGAAFHSGNQLRPSVDLMWCVAIGLLVAALTLAPERSRPSTRWAGRAASTAAWSYSLYLVHLPIIYFAQAAAGYDGARRIGDPLLVLAIFLVSVAGGWLFSVAVERPSRWLVQRSTPRLLDPASPATRGRVGGEGRP